MYALKKLVIALALAGMSTAVLAAPAGEAQVKAAAEGAIAKIEEAVNLVSTDASNKEGIINAINDARQLQKEFRYEGTERMRQKANDKLRVSREAFESGDTKAAEEKLKEALANFVEMKAIYDASHK